MSDDLANRFTYHPPTPVKALQHENVRAVLLSAAQELSANLPAGREKSLVITHLEEAMFWANAAIARNT